MSPVSPEYKDFLLFQVRALSCKDPAPPPHLERLAHLILALALCCTRWIFGHQLVGDLDVEIALVLVVGFVHEHAAYLLSLLHG
jgi:hypothetical protein